MKPINEVVKKEFGHYPEKILQFGEGNFLRAFVDWMVEKANREGIYRGSIVLCQPNGLSARAKELKNKINDQDGLYTLIMRGLENNRPVEKTEVITSISRCINPYDDYEELKAIARSEALEVVVSNTTEAGITYHPCEWNPEKTPASFPAKVTALLYERFLAFDGAADRGLLFLPVELIDQNGQELKNIILKHARDWGLEKRFQAWVEEANHFTNTLVDRIVTGYPGEEAAALEEAHGYRDSIMVACEPFHLWVIEGDRRWASKLPVHKTDDRVIWTEDVKPYKKRKVRILNGAHTSMVPAAYLAGFDTVLDVMKDEVFSSFLDQVLFQEVIPTLDLPKEELTAFAQAVKERFSNPYIRHQLLDIALNSCSKFTARCLPSLLTYVQKEGSLPRCLVFSLAALLKFYQGEQKEGGYTGVREDKTEYPIRDEKEVILLFEKAWSLPDTEQTVQMLLSASSLWGGQNLDLLPGLTQSVARYLTEMEDTAVKELIQTLVS